MTVSKLNARTIVAFTLPAIPISALGLPLVVYLPPFYGGEMGLGLSVVGTIFAIARVWDIFTDPVLGVVSDKISSPFGRRRFWIIFSVPILVASAYALFLPKAPVSPSYLLVWMVVLYVGYTMLSISHMSWGAELSDDYHDRSKIQGWREFALTFGTLAVLAIPAVVQQTHDANDTLKVASMGWFVILVLPVAVGLSVSTVGERPLPPSVSIGWRRSIAIVAKNRLLQRVLLADFLMGLAPGITGSIYIFFISHVMALSEWSSLILLLFFVASLVGVPLWIWLSCRLGKHQTFIAAMVWMALMLPLLLWVEPGNLTANVIVNALYGLAGGASPFLLRSILADVTDFDTLKSGTQRTGLYYALLMMTNKFGYALAVGIMYPVLDRIGFVPEQTNTAATLEGLKMLFVFSPMVLVLLSAAVMWRFPLDANAQLELRRQLAERNRNS
ncbi:MFS transporter [Baaleninema simplex]|uniref:MFS transporter n=1 Tax=Baaleninema simplex TaxID=2862350 RepID=UPI00036CA6AC|nr:MFS transporter [Baaleninema simplex]